MSRFERMLFPIVILIAIAVMLLERSNEQTVVVVARVVGILLVTLLVLGFVARSVVKYRRAKSQLDEMKDEMDRLRVEIAEEDAAGESPLA